MSKYAVIKVGSSQEKVSVGDEFSVSSSFNEDSLIPVLVSPRKGQIVVDDKELKSYKVELEFISDSKSKKMNIFQYKNKTGNRRRVGYRENEKIVKVVSIEGLESAEEEECQKQKLVVQLEMVETQSPNALAPKFLMVRIYQQAQ